MINTPEHFVLNAGRLRLTVHRATHAWKLTDEKTQTLLLESDRLALMTPRFNGVEMTDTPLQIEAQGDALVIKSSGQSWGHHTVTIKPVAAHHALDVSLRIHASCELSLHSVTCFPKETGLNFHRLINYRNQHHTEAVWPDLSLGSGKWETDTASRDWQFAPHPTLMFLQRSKLFLGFGAMQLPVGQFGMHFKATKYKLEHWWLDFGGDPHGHPLASNQVFECPTFRLGLGEHETGFDAYAAFGQQLLEAGAIPSLAARKATQISWAREPLYCTWIDQCLLALEQPATELQDQANTFNHPTRTVLTEDLVRRAVRVIQQQQLPLKTILLDEGWHRARGVWEAHPGRFPDLRRLVDELHTQGFKVIVWWGWPEIEKAVESQIDPKLLMGAGKRNRHGQMMYDFSDPHVRESYLKPLFRKLFSSEPGCYDLDGLKTDFMADKVHADMPLKDNTWRGEENYLYRVHEMLYRELKANKPDGVHIGCAGHYWLSQFIDINRTYDVHSTNVLEHENRARMLLSTAPGCPVAYDFHLFTDHVEDFFDSAAKLGCSVEVGNLLYCKANPLSQPEPANARYYEILKRKLAQPTN